MTFSALVPTDAEDPISTADWIEATLLIEGRHRIARAEILVRLEEHTVGEAGDTDVDFAFTEIARRARLGRDYPFGLDGKGVTASADAGESGQVPICV